MHQGCPRKLPFSHKDSRTSDIPRDATMLNKGLGLRVWGLRDLSAMDAQGCIGILLGGLFEVAIEGTRVYIE